MDITYPARKSFYPWLHKLEMGQAAFSCLSAFFCRWLVDLPNLQPREFTLLINTYPRVANNRQIQQIVKNGQLAD
jgi:hypothetical protein